MVERNSRTVLGMRHRAVTVLPSPSMGFHISVPAQIKKGADDRRVFVKSSPSFNAK
jgi:hypothetical protein